jgi:hypothetical protein
MAPEWVNLFGNVLSAVLGAIAGGIAAYALQAKHEARKQYLSYAHDFVSRNYLPLVACLDELARSSFVVHDYNERDPAKVDEYRLLEVHGEAINHLQQSIRNFFNSGMFLIFQEFDERSYIEITGALSFYLGLATEGISVEDVSRNIRATEGLQNRISRIPIPMLVNQYQRILTKGLRPRSGGGIVTEGADVVVHDEPDQVAPARHKSPRRRS